MIEILDKIGGWPVVKGVDWRVENWDWIDAGKIIAAEGLIDDIILDIRIITDTKNSLKRIIAVVFLLHFCL